MATSAIRLTLDGAEALAQLERLRELFENVPLDVGRKAFELFRGRGLDFFVCERVPTTGADSGQGVHLRLAVCQVEYRKLLAALGADEGEFHGGTYA